MAKSMKLSLAFLIVSSVFTINCARTDLPDQTPGNSSAPIRPAANSTVSPSQTSPDANVPAQVPVNSNAATPTPANANTGQKAPTATIRARDVKAIAGRDMTLEIELESKEDITVMVFSLDFDPGVFTYVSSSLSPGAPKSAVLTVNAEQTAAGKFGALIDSSLAFAVGKKPVMTVVFRVSPEAPARDHKISFSSKPARQSVSTIKTELVETQFTPATIHVAATR